MHARLLIISSIFFAGCYLRANQPDPHPARVSFDISPDTARLYHDGHFLGSARALRLRPLRFATGPREFTIVAEGYFPHDTLVDLLAGETTIAISLRPIPSALPIPAEPNRPDASPDAGDSVGGEERLRIDIPVIDEP